METIDHASIRVSDLEASTRLYRAALAALGFTEYETFAGDGVGLGFGRDGEAFSIKLPIADPGRDTVTTGVHLAFTAESRADVDAFHKAAIENGARNIGAPGIRRNYSSGYYGAFVLDLDGNNIEAVAHGE
jgi:catechol 2,3-dioxygenase-like lactoylglutathione lyase family enzyme